VDGQTNPDGLGEYEQVVEAELKTLALDNHETRATEHAGRHVRLESVVLFYRHAVEDAESYEYIEDGVHCRGWNRCDYQSAWDQHVGARLGPVGEIFRRHVLEDRQHGDDFERAFLGAHLRKASPPEPEALAIYRACEQGIEAEAETEALSEMAEQAVVEAADVENPRAIG